MAESTFESGAAHVGCEREAISARAKYFPGWWVHIGTDSKPAPLFRVVCMNRSELELARSVEPDVVEADYVLIDSLGR